MEESIDLTKILKVGDRVYSTISGDGVVKSTDKASKYPIFVMFDNGTCANFTAYGLFRENYGECVLFPSKENRDWSKYISIMSRRNFKPFERVLCRKRRDEQWTACLFSHYLNDSDDFVVTVGGGCYYHCIPYEGNEHLLGTNKKP